MQAADRRSRGAQRWLRPILLTRGVHPGFARLALSGAGKSKRTQ
jgi:hypothetical protein